MLSTFLSPHPNPLSSKKPNISPPISVLTHSVSHTDIYWGSTMSCAPRERGWNHTQPCSWDHSRLGEMERHSNIDHHCNLARTVGWRYPLSVPHKGGCLPLLTPRAVRYPICTMMFCRKSFCSVSPGPFQTYMPCLVQLDGKAPVLRLGLLVLSPSPFRPHNHLFTCRYLATAY